MKNNTYLWPKWIWKQTNIGYRNLNGFIFAFFSLHSTRLGSCVEVSEQRHYVLNYIVHHSCGAIDPMHCIVRLSVCHDQKYLSAPRISSRTPSQSSHHATFCCRWKWSVAEHSEYTTAHKLDCQHTLISFISQKDGRKKERSSTECYCDLIPIVCLSHIRKFATTSTLTYSCSHGSHGENEILYKIVTESVRRTGERLIEIYTKWFLFAFSTPVRRVQSTGTEKNHFQMMN